MRRRSLQFRRQIGLDPDALSPVMFVAGAGADFNSWLPQRINAEADCLAPVEIDRLTDLYDIPVMTIDGEATRWSDIAARPC